MIIQYIIIITVFIFGARGDLVSYEFLNEIDKESSQAVLNAFIPTAPTVEYDIEMYSILYETIDQFGNQTIASGVIVIPVGQLETLPLLSFHHGTEVKRSNTYSQNGVFDVLFRPHNLSCQLKV